MKATYITPVVEVCCITAERFIATSMYDTLGDYDVQLSRHKKFFDDEDDTDTDSNPLPGTSVWD